MQANELNTIYEEQANKRVATNIDTTEKQLLFDISCSLLRIEKALSQYNQESALEEKPVIDFNMEAGEEITPIEEVKAKVKKPANRKKKADMKED